MCIANQCKVLYQTNNKFIDFLLNKYYFLDDDEDDEDDEDEDEDDIKVFVWIIVGGCGGFLLVALVLFISLCYYCHKRG